ncbi:hypothetical protein [Stenotrophomonas sp. GD03657]|uniref:hypothetical protein n=1 Tax=Stenotrophomonas sp. GD03657 TaxID=2975363 RepID=UPI00244B2ECE|nr:hypothetical protein [Stenotrophomonas sp. GD03657]MDH2154056.1 hypothetical protein [Stenotrophomonas sp. GD03657]
MTRLIDLTGQTFGSWLVVGPYTRINKTTYWSCRCGCGVVTDIAASSLRAGTSTQCQACASRTHGAAGNFQQNNTTPEYSAWHNARSRCNNQNNPKYADYGGRGIDFHPDWANSFEKFLEEVGPKPEGYVLDREDNDKGYVPGNVRWVTYSESNKNRRKKEKDETVP